MKYQVQTMTLNIPSHNETITVPHDVKQQGEDTSTDSKRSNRGRKTSSVHVEEKIGEGGMGTVYLAHQDIIDRKVAVKRLKHESRTLFTALIEEAKITGRLEHPNIIPIHSVQIDSNDSPEVVMKYIQGTTFSKKISDNPTDQEIRENLQVILQICHPLEFAHNQNILHRDIKPENIMLGAFGEVYLLDWGLAMDTDNAAQMRSGLVGTPAYMSPEMTKGDPKLLSPATDIFLLGACLHQILTGKPRHEGKTLNEALSQAKRSKPYLYPKGIRSIIGQIANKACAFHMNLRYSNIQEFRNALSQVFDRWDAIQLTQTAEGLLTELNEMLKNSDIDPFQVHATFNQARFAFAESLKLFPQNHEAKKGIDQSIFTMTKIMLRLNQASYAQQLLNEADEKDPVLQNAIFSALSEQRQQQQAAEHKTVLLEQFNPKQSVSYRVRLSFQLLCVNIAFAFLALGMVVSQKTHLSAHLLATFSVVILLLLGQKYFFSTPKERGNTISKQTSLIAFSHHCGIGILAFSSLFSSLNWDPYLLGAGLIGMMTVALYPIFKKGWLSIVVTLISVLLPIPTLASFFITSIICYAMIFFEWNHSSTQS